jgi:hypothetical protein
MGQSPNMKHVVEDMANRHPDLLRVAHTSSADAWRFNQALAWELFSKHDKRFGMNFKRDTQELSMDVIAFRVGPTDRHVECFDVIADAGGANPTPVWNDITDFATMGQPGTARWAEPQPNWAAADSGGGTGVKPDAGGNDADVAKLKIEVAQLKKQVEELTGQVNHARAEAAAANSTATSTENAFNARIPVDDRRWLWNCNVEDRLVVNGAQVDGSVGGVAKVSGTAKLSDERDQRPQ